LKPKIDEVVKPDGLSSWLLLGVPHLLPERTVVSTETSEVMYLGDGQRKNQGWATGSQTLIQFTTKGKIGRQQGFENG